MTSPILPEVRAAFPKLVEGFEGREPGMYRDDAPEGYVTCAVGVLVDPMRLALPLPWLLPDETRAGPLAIAVEWTRVHDLPPGMVASHYVSPAGLHLDEDAIDALTLSHLDENVAILVVLFPDFASWPAAAQMGICLMAWALGAGFARTWPRFTAHARAQDWNGCADECTIPGANKPRNVATAALFRAAAAGVWPVP